MKQNEEEWKEYQNVMEDVIKRSGLRRNIFYDIRGNHDSFGVPDFGSSYDFFSKYSLSGQLGRRGPVTSVTIETGDWKLLFVGFDSTTPPGLRGPTNVFGHPTDEILSEISSKVSQWDLQSEKSVMKVLFGHFPLSFSAASYSGKSLKDIFLQNSISGYLCGHLHTRFGKNLKRHHQSSGPTLFFHKLFQLNARQMPSDVSTKCSDRKTNVKEFWELEMGDWRKSRAMRILAIDRGQLSFVDTDFKFGSKETIILPTFPRDSRFTSTVSSFHKHKCEPVDVADLGTIRTLVFSASPIVSVIARIYDSRPGNLVVVMEAAMRKHNDSSSRGYFYSAPWNFKAFVDESPDRFLLQIEAIDIMGRSTLSELRPFSVSGLPAKLSWTWKEFFVMGCQWEALYYPILWAFYLLVLSILLIPRAIFYFSRKQYMFKTSRANKSFIKCMAWALAELYGIPTVWLSIVVYLFYLILCPWLFGKIFTEGRERGYMTYRGWALKADEMGGLEFLGYPDVMVVVLPHLFFIVFPAILVCGALVAERGMFRDHLLSISRKKEDDYGLKSVRSASSMHVENGRMKTFRNKRWIRNILIVVMLAIFWKHIKNCEALMKAYEMNPIIHFPFYTMYIPLLLAYALYKTQTP